MIYFDPLYGKITLDDLTEEILHTCPEIKRLRYVGLMNYRCLPMLSLSNISRLEHSIGLSHLVSLSSKLNSFQHKKDFIVAALYHDVNCTPFGHAIEWAIDRFTDFSHEDSAAWIVSDFNSTDVTKPVFFDPAGLRRLNIREKYNLSMERIYNIIKGNDFFVINNKGIDLDNIDNVYRMGFYLGMLNDERTYPVILANNLKVVTGFDNFVLPEKFLHILEHWYALRSRIYKTFIYSRDYIAFEHLLFAAVSEYVKSCSKDDIINLWSQTDDSILALFLKQKKEMPELNALAKRILLFDFDHVYGLLRTSSIGHIKLINDSDFQSRILADVISAFNLENTEAMPLSPTKFRLHVTTDNRKTNRRIPLYVQRQNAEIEEHSIGKDEQYLVIGILGKYNLSKKSNRNLMLLLSKAFTNHTSNEFIEVPFSDDDEKKSSQLGLFDA